MFHFIVLLVTIIATLLWLNMWMAVFASTQPIPQDEENIRATMRLVLTIIMGVGYTILLS